MEDPKKEAVETRKEDSDVTTDSEAKLDINKVLGASLSKLRSLNKKTWATIGIVSAVVVVLIVGLQIFFSPINKFSRALKNGEITQAQELFDKNSRDKNFSTKANEKLANHLMSIEDSYVNGKTTYETAWEDTKAVAPLTSVQDTLDFLQEISKSKAAFDSAEEAESNGDFYSAIEKYEEVSPEDTKNYAVIEKRIAAAKNSLVAKALKDSGSLAQSGDYSAAIIILTDVRETGYATPEVDSALLQNVSDMIEICKEPSDYYEAYDQIKDIELEGISPLMSKAISAASKATVSKAEKFIDQKKYVDAFEVLALAKGDFVTPEIEKTLNNCTNLAANATLDEAKKMMSNQQYQEACELLHDIDSRLLTDDVKAVRAECEGLYKQSVLRSAAELAKQGDYDGAIAELKEGQKFLSGQDLTDKIGEYELEKLKINQLVTVEDTWVRESSVYNYAHIVVKNQTDKVLKEYSIAMIMLDSNGYPVNNRLDEFRGKNVKRGRADSVNVQPGGTYGTNSYWYVENDCYKILACVVSAEFYDGTIWENPYFDPWVKFYAERPIQ